MLIAKEEQDADQDNGDLYAKSSVGRSSFRSKSIQKQINQAMENEEEKDLSKENKTMAKTDDNGDDSQYQEYLEFRFEQGILKYNQKVTSILKNIEK